MRMASRRIVGPLIGLGLLAAMGTVAQVAIQPRTKNVPKESQDPLDKPTLRVDTNLVLVPVSVNDALNRPVSGLEKENFRLYDDKIEQNDQPIRDGRRAGRGGPGVRHQRQHGRQAEALPYGRARIFQDRQSRGRVLLGGVRQLPRAWRCRSRGIRDASKASSSSPDPRAPRRFSTPSTWRFTR